MGGSWWVHAARVALRRLWVGGVVVENAWVWGGTVGKHHVPGAHEPGTTVVIIIEGGSVHGGWVGVMERGHGLGLRGVWGSAKPYFCVPMFRTVGVSGVGEFGLLVARGWHSLGVTPGVWGVGRVETGLDESLPCLGRNHGLEFPGGEGVDVTRLRGNQEHYLGPRQCWELVGLEGWQTKRHANNKVSNSRVMRLRLRLRTGRN
jgi:hypothetical protein